eukprot:8362602-Pyramimonas_sp.AAC.2
MDYSMLLGVHFREAKSNEYLAHTLGLELSSASALSEGSKTVFIADRMASFANLVKKPAMHRCVALPLPSVLVHATRVRIFHVGVQ